MRKRFWIPILISMLLFPVGAYAAPGFQDFFGKVLNVAGKAKKIPKISGILTDPKAQNILNILSKNKALSGQNPQLDNILKILSQSKVLSGQGSAIDINSILADPSLQQIFESLIKDEGFSEQAEIDATSILADPVTQEILQILNQGTDESIAIDRQIGGVFAPIAQVILNNEGALGIPDPSRSRTQALDALPNERPLNGINPLILGSGQNVIRGNDRFIQKILSKEGQQIQAQQIEAVGKSINRINILTKVSSDQATGVRQSAKSIRSMIEPSTSSARSATEQALLSTLEGAAIQEAVSTQGAVKGLGNQNAQIATILAEMSKQNAQASSQRGGIGTQLSGLSNQLTTQSGQLREISTISGAQHLTLKQIASGQALQNQATTELLQEIKGRRQAEELDRAAAINGGLGEQFGNVRLSQ